MSWAATLKRIDAERRRNERSALQRQKQLERNLKELVKLTALEQARMEVEAYENTLEVLMTVHREAGARFDWFDLLVTLPSCLLPRTDIATIEAERADVEKMRALAAAVISGDCAAYAQAIQKLSPFAELATLGSSITFRFLDSKTAECELFVNGRDAIPAEVKSLTANGKLSKKAMPKSRLHEAYQDYVCGCVLRVAREALALLPVETAIVTAFVNVLGSKTGKDESIPVLSAAFPRNVIEGLEFERLDPSDCMENFTHRGDVKLSRKSGEFVSIVPLTPDDLPQACPPRKSLSEILEESKALRQSIASLRSTPKAEAAISNESNEA